MYRNRTRQALMGAVTLALLTLLPAGLRAGQDRPWHGYGMAHGMMGPGMGPAMMMGPGMGYGMGPAMMMGPGMGYGMGPGMMMGPGMGYGMGPAMMMGHMMGMMHGYGGYGLGLDLSDEQREQIQNIHRELRKQHWELMGKVMDKRDQLGDLYAQEMPDPKQVGQAYGELAKLGQQMIEAQVRAQNRVHEVLTEEQRQQLRRWHSGGWPSQPRARPEGGMGGHMMGR